MDEHDLCLWKAVKSSKCDMVYDTEKLKVMTILGMMAFVLSISYIKCT